MSSLTVVHKALLEQLALDHVNHVETSLRLARAHFSEEHPTVLQLQVDLQVARETVDGLRSEQARVAA